MKEIKEQNRDMAHIHVHENLMSRCQFFAMWSIDSIQLQLSQNKVIVYDDLALSVQFSSVTQSYPTLCNPINCSTPGLPVHHQLPEFAQTHVHESVMPSSHLILCRPLLLLPPIPPSIRVFSNESTLRMRWPSTGVSALAPLLPLYHNKNSF